MKQKAWIYILVVLLILAIPTGASAAAVLVIDPINSVVANPAAGAGHKELFANQANPIRVNVTNTGDEAATNVVVTLAIGNYNQFQTIANLAASASADVDFTGFTPTSTGAIQVTVSINGEEKYAQSHTIYYTGNKGKRWTGGDDLETKKKFDGNINVIYSTGDSEYKRGTVIGARTPIEIIWTAGNLNIPAGATITYAGLYQGYGWNKMGDPMGSAEPAPMMSFNSQVITNPTKYIDQKGYGTYNYPYGLYVYDVTTLFNTAGNTLQITPEADVNAANNYALYGSYLVIVYEEPNEARRSIWINEEIDMLYLGATYATTVDETRAYAPFTGVSTTNLNSAKAIGIAYGTTGVSNTEIWFNNNQAGTTWQAAPDPDPQVRFSNEHDITGNIINGDNLAEFRLVTGTSGSWPHVAILVTEYSSSGTEVDLQSGWTLISTDKHIDSSASSWQNHVIAYKHDASTGYSEASIADLRPVDALYVKSSNAGKAYLVYSDGVQGASSKSLKEGWNLISSATETKANAVLSQLRYVQAGNSQGAGLTTFVSQGTYNKNPNNKPGAQYLSTLSDADWTALATHDLSPYNGYWVHMNGDKVFGVIPA